MSPYQTLTDQL